MAYAKGTEVSSEISKFVATMWGVFDSEGDEGDAPWVAFSTKAEAEGWVLLTDANGGCATGHVAEFRMIGVWRNSTDDLTAPEFPPAVLAIASSEDGS